jgi:hypothetical protein
MATHVYRDVAIEWFVAAQIRCVRIIEGLVTTQIYGGVCV